MNPEVLDLVVTHRADCRSSSFLGVVYGHLSVTRGFFVKAQDTLGRFDQIANLRFAVFKHLALAVDEQCREQHSERDDGCSGHRKQLAA